MAKSRSNAKAIQTTTAAPISGTADAVVDGAAGLLTGNEVGSAGGGDQARGGTGESTSDQTSTAALILNSEANPTAAVHALAVSASGVGGVPTSSPESAGTLSGTNIFDLRTPEEEAQVRSLALAALAGPVPAAIADQPVLLSADEGGGLVKMTKNVKLDGVWLEFGSTVPVSERAFRELFKLDAIEKP